MRYLFPALSGTTAFVMLLGGCGDDDGGDVTPVIDPGDGGSYTVSLDPADFVATVDNPYLPFIPGSKWVYDAADGSEHIEVEVLAETRVVAGITATVVRDTASEDGEVIEDTYDWYAQDKDGNVWYLGEDTKEYEDGKVSSTAGSWEAGVDGAQPGVIMWTNPEVGKGYRQEYYQDEAEDMAEVTEAGASESVPYGGFEDLLVIKEWTPLEPDVVENKYYARGIGVVLEEIVQGGGARTELTSFTPGN